MICSKFIFIAYFIYHHDILQYQTLHIANSSPVCQTHLQIYIEPEPFHLLGLDEIIPEINRLLSQPDDKGEKDSKQLPSNKHSNNRKLLNQISIGLLDQTVEHHYYYHTIPYHTIPHNEEIYNPRLLRPGNPVLAAAFASVSILSWAVHTRRISLLFVSRILPPMHSSFNTWQALSQWKIISNSHTQLLIQQNIATFPKYWSSTSTQC